MLFLVFHRFLLLLCLQFLRDFKSSLNGVGRLAAHSEKQRRGRAQGSIQVTPVGDTNTQIRMKIEGFVPTATTCECVGEFHTPSEPELLADLVGQALIPLSRADREEVTRHRGQDLQFIPFSKPYCRDKQRAAVSALLHVHFCTQMIHVNLCIPG